ncbi:MAG: hypothetical protein LBS56_04965 [Propionibacteriaceae bacterium]|jgi:hypothetical protein|nr:hypothetical protein [Propionibacteriaceae bacterium]
MNQDPSAVTRRIARSLALALAAPLVFSGFAAPASADTTDMPQLSYTVDRPTRPAGRPITVAVVVRDSAHRPIAGLTADDFALFAGPAVRVLDGPTVRDDGAYAFTITSDTPGTHYLSVSVFGLSIPGPAAVTFQERAPAEDIAALLQVLDALRLLLQRLLGILPLMA